jgi:hypothetical protein
LEGKFQSLTGIQSGITQGFVLPFGEIFCRDGLTATGAFDDVFTCKFKVNTSCVDSLGFTN